MTAFMKAFTSFVFLALASLGLCAQIFLSSKDNDPRNATIGIALTVDHATFSARYSDGSFKDLGRVEAHDNYIELMQRLSLPSSSHPTPPYHNMSEQFDDMPRQWWRRMRKRLGFPASKDVAILSELLDNVAHVAQPYMDDRKSAVITYPDLPALYQEDIRDAGLSAGITVIDGDRVGPFEPDSPPKHVAAYVGQGMGICTHFKNYTKCREEKEALPGRWLILFEYTETALLLHYDRISYAYVDRSPQGYMMSSFALGSAGGTAKEDIQDFFLYFLRQHIYCYEGSCWCECPKTITVIITGDPGSLSDGRARQAVEEAIEVFGSKPEIFDSNPDFVAARGAAEMGWRATANITYLPRF